MTKTAIHIDDLGEPRLSEVQAGALAWGETVEVDFSEQAILGAARERTGLADFGAEDFRERLRVLREAWNGDPEITRFHRTVLHGYLVRYASNRLLIHDTLARHPQILEERIERPIIVVGLPRSGTTHLVNLLAADPRLHSLPLWESCEPVPLPGETASGDATDPRYQRCAAAWAGMQQVTPLIAAMHPMNPDHIHEELELMGPDFASYNFEWLGITPQWRDHYYAHDQAPHYAYMKIVLRLLQWRRGQRKRWVLKCPQHLEQLPVLIRTFPDATVIFTHRDPVAVIQSTVTMQAYTQRMNRRHMALRELMTYWSDRIEHLLRACVRDRSVVPAERSIDSPFHAFMADQMGTMARVYTTAGIELDATALTHLERYIAAHPRGKEGQVLYDLRRDFDADPAALHERFRFYFDHHPVRREVQ
ncbi:MAG: sulfotransferase [Steroidobacteraceae bacterium]